MTALVLAVTIGVAADPAASGLPTTAPAAAGSGAGTVAETGQTTRVEVTAKGMTFTPSTITVPAGNRLVIVLHNADDSMAHDLILPTDRTARLDPGETAELDAGVMTESVSGYCSVAGHRQMGMILDIVVEGAPPGPRRPTATPPITWARRGRGPPSRPTRPTRCRAPSTRCCPP